MSPRRRPKSAKGQAGRRRTAALLVAAFALAAVVGVGATWILLSGGSPPGPRTAVIVDQLSLSQPNPALAETATNMLERAGYAVDYYPGEEVTVDFYRDLPSHGYDLIVLRVHSGLARAYGEPTDYVSLFTGEPFDETRHTAEGAAGLLGRAKYYDGSPEYYGIVPAFIEASMKGRFDGATVIMLGCDGLTTDTSAEAFVHKGANAVVGWSGLVSAKHTDAATESLLRHLLADGLSIRDAVAQTMAEVGPDPEFGSVLGVYPSKG